ncbi:hypothetical protein TanjilG_11920 [Lupinus angustifolius]|uniref:Putative zinc-finger domain-containing protein n=2 Tax=Lupinus angustifolius TaxID=3871 RepID=A0A1J7H3H6_LUPAN|nr:hypothetical protein TanjilG_11920 [Lupinus angustifolius]
MASSETATETPNPQPSTLPSKSREEGELSSSSSDYGGGKEKNPGSSTVQLAPAVGAVHLVQPSTLGVHGGSNNIQLQTTRQSASKMSIKENQLPPKSSPWTVHIGELSSSSDDGQVKPDSSIVQPAAPAIESSAVHLLQKSTQGIQGDSINIQLQRTRQSNLRVNLKKSNLPPKSSPWTGHVGSDENLVISFSDDDSGSDLEPKRNASRLGSNTKRPSSSLEKSNKLEQSARNAPKAMPKKLSLSRTFISSTFKVGGSNMKGVGSMPLGQGSRARNFNPINKKLASQEHGRDQGVVSDNKLQDLRHKIALRETELKLKAAHQVKESTSIPGRDHNATKLKNDAGRKYTPVSSEAAQLEPKEPDTKRVKLNPSYGTPQAVGGQQEVAATKCIPISKDSTLDNCYPQEKNKVNHSQKDIPLGRRESTIIRSQRQPDKQVNYSLQSMPCRSTDSDINYDGNQTEKSDRLLDPSIALNKNTLPANMTSNNVPKDLEELSNAVRSNHNGNANILEHSSIDLQSFFGMEELIDKELEEAQEHRHKCEIEERNALKVYLKAQRSLLQASVRCTDLYHKRELYASKLRSLILNNSSLSWTSGQQQHLEMGQDYLPRHGYEIPTSSSQRQAEYNDINNPSFDSNNQGINNGYSNTLYHRMNGTNLGSEPCIEPDASTSEPLLQRSNAADGGYSPSDELGMSGNENEEMSPAGHVSTHLDVENLRNKDSKMKLMDIDIASNGKGSTDSLQDPLQLEAKLRSELFARIGTRAMKSRNPCSNTEPAVERGAENEVGSEKSQVPHCVVPLSRAEENYLKGIERHERSICLDSKEMQTQHNIGGNLLNPNCSAVSGDQDDMPHQDPYSTNTINVSPLVYRSAYSQLREMLPFNSSQFLSKNNFIHANDGENENATCLASDETKWNNMLAIPMPVTVGNLLSEESSYSCSPAVDPFWPLCMFELRGKCNNDECPWQHVKDYGDGNICQRQQTNSNDPDCEGRLQMHQQNCNGAVKVPKCRTTTILPTYLVGLDTLKGDQFGYQPVVALGNPQGWQKCFSITLATSNLLRNGSPNDGPLLDVGAERIEVHGAWGKQLSSFQWRSAAGNQIKQAIGDGEQAVEMALLIVNQEINTLQGVRKALFVLSKALETDPTSVVLWVVYLLICYANLKPNEKDDIFFFAVKNCEESYVLWLMYINSRKRIDDQLAAYDAALSVLCQHASAASKDRMHESACILDLLLQMMDCLCMSGNVDKAIERSYGVFASKTKSDEPHHLPLSDILNCLTISDKCVFWICCVYLVIYRKLPEAVLRKFEHEKDLLDIEWPFVSLSDDEKEMAFKLVETAVESVDSYVYNESVKSEANLRSAQLFALNHIRSMVALGNLDCLRNLLDKYVKLYPSCIELVLVSARIKNHEIGVDSFMGFEEAINMWPKEVPGIQCIWNQYIENAIQNQKFDFAKEITARWFHTVWQKQDLQNRGMDGTAGNSCGSLGLNSKSLPDTSSSELHQIDVVFGFLNLSLYRIFQNDKTEACIAVDKARNAAMFGGLEQCLTKHIMFLICDSMSLKEDGAIKKVLEVYTDISSKASLTPKVLTRKFLQNIKKPRVQNLISNIICPVSYDCSLLNLILQSRYGSSLLPQTGSDPKHLVDFVEAIMKVVPYNFQLAINVCKLLRKGYNSSDLHSDGLWFWACSTLANAILDAVPIPPEYVWVEAGEFLQNGMGIEAISERFYKRALLVYPFSIMLWKCFYKLHKTIGDGKDVVEAAKEKGIDLVTDTVSGS